MDTQQIIDKLKIFQDNNDIDGALAFLNEPSDDVVPFSAVILSNWVDIIPKLDVELFNDLDGEIDDPGSFVLHIAAKQSPEMLRALILESFNLGLFAFNAEDETPAMIAARRGDIESLRILARAGADFDQVGPTTGKTALEVACHSGKADVVDYLLGAGADATLVDISRLETMENMEPLIAMIKDAAKLRDSVDLQRFKALEVSMELGQGSFIMPDKIQQTNAIFIADVIGDLCLGAKDAKMEATGRIFAKSSNDATAPGDSGDIVSFDLGDTRSIAKQGKIERDGDIKLPNGYKLH